MLTFYICAVMLSLIFTRRLSRKSLLWNLSLFSSAFAPQLLLLTGALLFINFATLDRFRMSALILEMVLLSSIILIDAREFSASWGDLLNMFKISNYFDFRSTPIDLKNSEQKKVRAKFYFAKEKTAPVIFQIFGGGFSAGGIQQINPYNVFLHQLGYHVVVLPYRRIPFVDLKMIIQDLQTEVEAAMEIFREKGFLPQRVDLSGRSAGGYLCFALAGKLPAKMISKIIAFYPIVDFQLIAQRANPGDLLGWPHRLQELFKNEGVSSEVLKKYSFPAFANLKEIQILAFHGDKDPVVDIEQSERLAQYLKMGNENSKVIFLKNQSHGFDANLHSLASQYCLRAISDFMADQKMRS